MFAFVKPVGNKTFVAEAAAPTYKLVDAAIVNVPLAFPVI